MALTSLNGCPLLERIGEGGIADVFRSEWQGRTVALKVLRDTERVSMRKRFLREGRLLQRLDHPGLVRCLHIFDTEQPALVLELLVGETLDERVARAPLGGEEAAHLLATLLRVLQYLHDRGVVHRDVKSQNIFLCVEQRVVLMDLGLAGDPADPLTTTLGDVLGTYAYMAPEQIAGAECDHRADLYSLGITAYEAICGTRPFSARGAAAWLEAHRGGAATPLGEVVSGVPVRVAGLVDRLMARDPAVRPPSAAVALAMLTGMHGVRRELQNPALVGRAAARGAIEAVLDAGGALVLTGPMGAGFGPLAAFSRRLAAEKRMEAVSFRGRSRMDGQDVYAVLARELARFGLPVEASSLGVGSTLADLVREGPLLLVAEDVDALGPSACEALESVIAVPGLSSVLLGVDLVGWTDCRVVTLRPLTLAEMGELLRSMLDTPALPTGLDAALRDASGGVPGLAVVLLREQVQASTLTCEGLDEAGRPQWRWDAAAGVIPGLETRRLLDRALRRLPPASRRALELLAVAGSAVPTALLNDALGFDDTGLDVGPLLRGGLAHTWSDSGEEWTSVTRAALERIVVGSMSEAARHESHRLLAAAAARRVSSEWDQRFLIVQRALGDGSPADVERLIELGEHLAATGRPMQALHTLELVPESLEASLLARRAFARAEALRASGRLVESREALAAAARLDGGERVSPDALELELAVAMGVPPSQALVDRATARGRTGAPDAALALGDLALLRGQAEDAEDWYATVLSGTLVPVDRLAVRARLALAEVQVAAGKLDEAERAVLGLVRELRGRDRRTALAESFLALSTVQRLRGQLARAWDSADFAAEASGRRDVRVHQLHVELLRAWCCVGAGDLLGAEQHLAQARAARQRGGTYRLQALYFEVLCELRRAQGDTPALLAGHLAGLDAARAAGDPVRSWFHDGMAGLHTASARVVSEAAARLGDMRAHHALGRLLLVGAVVGRDPSILDAAEPEARISGDPLLLLEILHAQRAESRRAEARTLARSALDGLHGRLRELFEELPQVIWALQAPSGPRGAGR